MPDGVIPNIIDMFAGINQRKRAKREREALENYLNDPAAAEAALMDSNINPQRGMELRAKRKAEEAAARDKGWAMFTATAPLLRGIEDPEQIASVLDGLAPALTEYMGEQGFGNLRTAVMKDPTLATRMDADAWKALVDQNYQPYTLQGGQQRFVGDTEIAAGRYKRDIVEVPRADGGKEIVLFDPNTGEFVLEDGTPAPPDVAASAQQLSAVQRDFDAEFGGGQRAVSAPPRMTVEAMRPIFRAQESNHNYTAVNKETGALGAYQVMPATGAALAARLGMVWSPKLMTSDTPEGRRYQDAIGGAAIEEAIQASGGDPRTMAMYYHGGSDRGKWGPRTRKYGDDILSRMGGNASAMVAAPPEEPRIGRTRISAPGRQERYRPATAEELRGYPDGTAAQVDINTGKLVNIKTPPAASTRAPSAAAAKQTAKNEAAAQATRMTSSILQDMARSYVALSNMGNSIVDSRRGGGANFMSWINSSSIGQALGDMTGDEAQSVRQQINQSRPLLLNQIRQASEMGARGLDSNKELEFYLQAATDPSRELIANFAAIHILDIAYGNGDALARALPPDLFKAVDERARILASEQGSDYLFQNTGQRDPASSGAGMFTVRRKAGQ